MERRPSLKDACRCKFMRHFTRKELVPWLCKSGGGLMACILLFFFNVLLIMECSYAVNGLTYNMTTGCLFTDTHCNQTLLFYAQGPLGHLMGWAAFISITEICILLIVLALQSCITTYCRARYEAYRLAMVNELPYAPANNSDEIDLSSEDYTL